jgi:hypothetical protein
MADNIVDNLKQPAQWLRIAFMLALAVALYLAGMVLTLLIIAQALFGVFTGSDNPNLRALGAALTAYVRQVLDFLTYNSDFKPFPFAPFVAEPAFADAAADATDMDQEQDVEVHIPEGSEVEQDDDAPPAAKPARRRGSRSAQSRNDSDGE